VPIRYELLIKTNYISSIVQSACSANLVGPYSIREKMCLSTPINMTVRICTIDTSIKVNLKKFKILFLSVKNSNRFSAK